MNKIIEKKCDTYKEKSILDYRQQLPECDKQSVRTQVEYS